MNNITSADYSVCLLINSDTETKYELFSNNCENWIIEYLVYLTLHLSLGSVMKTLENWYRHKQIPRMILEYRNNMKGTQRSRKT